MNALYFHVYFILKHYFFLLVNKNREIPWIVCCWHHIDHHVDYSGIQLPLSLTDPREYTCFDVQAGSLATAVHRCDNSSMWPSAAVFQPVEYQLASLLAIVQMFLVLHFKMPLLRNYSRFVASLKWPAVATQGHGVLWLACRDMWRGVARAWPSKQVHVLGAPAFFLSFFSVTYS